ncbi:MAG TPA: YdeI/OmpD-associated family protein [Candidatus Bathyarchaeia archaeon]|nr:YdeI/OmpD-associated family protein [Candidatus Bathyarchaeia archaeon]
MAHESNGRLYAKDRSAWREWLAHNHATSRGIWVVYHKGTAHPALSFDHVVDEALCFGWIDSRVHSLDATQAMLYVAPRKPKSPWSRANKQRVARLIGAGMMTDAGLAVIETAKADGSWTSYDAIEALIVPSDLAGALADKATARDNFGALTPASKKQILWYLASAKRPVTRKKRIALVVDALQQNKNPLEHNARTPPSAREANQARKA